MAVTNLDPTPCELAELLTQAHVEDYLRDGEPRVDLVKARECYRLATDLLQDVRMPDIAVALIWQLGHHLGVNTDRRETGR